MFTVIEKATKQPVVVYGTHYFKPKEFYHNGYIAFIVFDKNFGGFSFADSEDYEIAENELVVSENDKFTVTEKATKQPVVVYGTHYFEAKEFHHDGYIGFLVYDENFGGFSYADSEDYTVSNI